MLGFNGNSVWMNKPLSVRRDLSASVRDAG